MKKSTLVTGCLVMASLFIGCSSNGGEDNGSGENSQEMSPASSDQQEWEPEVYETSELAALMRKMYDDNMVLKEMVSNGEVPQSFPEDFYTIHTAEATDPDEIDQRFKVFADQYLKDMETVVESEPETVRKAFNDMVNTCVSCHQLYCQGPIPKIKKLLVKE